MCQKMFLVRSGPETIVLTFKKHFERAEPILLKWGEFAGNDIEGAFSSAGEFNRIAVIWIKDPCRAKDELRVYISETCIQRLLCAMLGECLGEGISESRMQPGYILVRLIGDIENGIKKIGDEFNGKPISNDPYFEEALPEESSVIYFTDRPLNHHIPHSFIYPKALYIEEHSKEKLLATLRMKQNEYLGDSMGTPDWNSMEIQIGDKEGRFRLHRKRIWTAVQGLQIGSILEEGWKREYTLIGKMVDVYLLRLFTPFAEDDVKTFLVGLEYDDKGARVADIDLFSKGKKISMRDVGRGSRADHGTEARKRMLEKLDGYSRLKMQKLDDELALL